VAGLVSLLPVDDDVPSAVVEQIRGSDAKRERNIWHMPVD
jgi:hypothetical protein